MSDSKPNPTVLRPTDEQMQRTALIELINQSSGVKLPRQNESQNKPVHIAFLLIPGTDKLGRSIQSNSCVRDGTINAHRPQASRQHASWKETHLQAEVARKQNRGRGGRLPLPLAYCYLLMQRTGSRFSDRSRTARMRHAYPHRQETPFRSNKHCMRQKKIFAHQDTIYYRKLLEWKRT